MNDYGNLTIADLGPGRLDAILEAGRHWIDGCRAPGLVDRTLLVADDGGTIAIGVRFDSKEAYDEAAVDTMPLDWFPEGGPHLDGEVRRIDGTWHDVAPPGVAPPGVRLAEELGRCFAEQRFTRLAELYADDARFELHVGADHDQRTGRDQIRDRYAEDFAIRPEFVRWDPVATARGATVEAEALQDSPAGRLRFRWVHLLEVSGGRIQRDTVYCTGGIVADP